MDFLKKVKGFLPPSSRSFHGLYGEVLQMREDMREALGVHHEMKWDIRERFDQLQKTATANGVNMQMLAFSLYRGKDESYDESRERFFLNIPKATGEARLVQLACLQLMSGFDALCKQHGLTYWMVSGTLLGAVRHQGFIPWDDDVDLGMPRNDLLKLMEIVSDDDNYEITEVFDCYAHCRQVRFWYRDESIPCFLDVFFFDYTTVAPRKAFKKVKADRAHLVDLLENDSNLDAWNHENPFIKSATNTGRIIDAHFASVIEAEFADDGFLTNDKEAAKGLVWSADNLDPLTGRPLFFDYESIYPIGEAEFEGRSFNAPNNPASVLTAIFGDYLSLPNDVKKKSFHMSEDAFEEETTIDALKRATAQLIAEQIDSPR